jgi:hypothetical protein
MRNRVRAMGRRVPFLPGICDMGACVCSEGSQPSLVALGGGLVFFLVAGGLWFSGRLVVGCLTLNDCCLG